LTHGVWRVEITPRAEREIRSLPASIRRRVARPITALSQHARPSGVRKLTGAADLYRLRVGDYRVLYQIRDEAHVIVILRVGHRRLIYR
jgi:mRNA interferase RelE/StbE